MDKFMTIFTDVNEDLKLKQAAYIIFKKVKPEKIEFSIMVKFIKIGSDLIMSNRIQILDKYELSSIFTHFMKEIK